MNILLLIGIPYLTQRTDIGHWRHHSLNNFPIKRIMVSSKCNTVCTGDDLRLYSLTIDISIIIYVEVLQANHPVIEFQTTMLGTHALWDTTCFAIAATL